MSTQPAVNNHDQSEQVARWFAVGVALLSAGALGRPGYAETGLLTIESDQQLADNTREWLRRSAMFV